MCLRFCLLTRLAVSTPVPASSTPNLAPLFDHFIPHRPSIPACLPTYLARPVPSTSIDPAHRDAKLSGLTLTLKPPLPSSPDDLSYPLPYSTHPHIPQTTTASMSSPPWDYIAKLVCIGDSGCGKSSLTIRLCEGRFVQHHDVTIGVEFGSRIVPVGAPHSTNTIASSGSDPSTAASPTAGDAGPTSSPSLPPPVGLPAPPRQKEPPPPQKHMKLSLWDTAGQETYKSVTRSYFRGASGALLVFDLSRRSTFGHVTDWLNDLRQIAEPDIVVILVGNKADLAASPGAPDRREVSSAEAADWARRNGVLRYVETSAKSGENVEEAFLAVAERIYQNIMAGKYDLNDRRSGVKGPGAGWGGGGGGGGMNVRLDQSKNSGGGMCC